MVAEHTGPGGWSAAVADLVEGRADVIAVPSVERLGHGRQVFARITLERASKAMVDAHPRGAVKLCVVCGLVEQLRRGGGLSAALVVSAGGQERDGLVRQAD